MTNQLWSEDSAAIVLLPSGAVAAEIMELVSEWTKCWMLKPALWVSDEDIATSPTGPPRFYATVTGRNGSQRVDLFTQLNRLNIEKITVVAARIVGQSEKTDLKQDKSVDLLEEYIEKSRPLRTRQNGQEVGIKIKKVNLIFAPTEQKGASYSQLLESHWDVNIVVAPEDRSTPNSFDGFTRYEDTEKMNGFVLSNIASTAGIWSGQQKGIFELSSENSDLSPVQNQVRVMRTFVRSILSEGLSVRVAVEALKKAGDVETSSLSGRAIPNKYLVAYEKPDSTQVIDGMLVDALNSQNGALKYNQKPLGSELVQNELGVAASIKFFFRSSWSLIKVLPLWFFAALWNFIARLVTAKLFGARGREVAKGTIDFPRTDLDKDSIVHLNEIKDRREKIKNVLDKWPKNTLRKSEPSLWADLRKLVLGRLDGSTLPQGLTHTEDSVGVRVLGDLNEVMPSLHASWNLPPEISRDLESDPRGATWRELDVLDDIENFLMKRVSNGDLEVEQLTQKLNELEGEIEKCEGELQLDLEKLYETERQNRIVTIEGNQNV